MTLVVELDDRTPVGVSTVRETLTAYAPTNRVVSHLTRGDAELAVGFRGERGACYWRRDDDLVSHGGDNPEVEGGDGSDPVRSHSGLPRYNSKTPSCIHSG